MAAEISQCAELTLNGRRVLLIEDEYFIADDVRKAIEQAGGSVIGPANSLASAQRRIEQGGFDCVVLDLNLNGESAISVADLLVADGREFVIATGYGSPVIPERLKTVPRIEKPFDPAALLRLVSQLDCGRVA